MDYINIPGTSVNLYDGSVVQISRFGTTKWILHKGWYTYTGATYNGWYYSAVPSQDIIPFESSDLSTIVVISTCAPTPPTPPTPPVPIPWIPKSVEHYNTGVNYKEGQVVYLTFGELYQCTTQFTSSWELSTPEENFEYDITHGNLIKVDALAEHTTNRVDSIPPTPVTFTPEQYVGAQLWYTQLLADREIASQLSAHSSQFVYNCTGTNDTDNINTIINTFINDATSAGTLNLKIEGTVGFGNLIHIPQCEKLTTATSTYFHIKPTQFTVKKSVTLDFSNASVTVPVPTISAEELFTLFVTVNEDHEITAETDQYLPDITISGLLLTSTDAMNTAFMTELNTFVLSDCYIDVPCMFTINQIPHTLSNRIYLYNTHITSPVVAEWEGCYIIYANGSVYVENSILEISGHATGTGVYAAVMCEGAGYVNIIDSDIFSSVCVSVSSYAKGCTIQGSQLHGILLGTSKEMNIISSTIYTYTMNIYGTLLHTGVLISDASSNEGRSVIRITDCTFYTNLDSTATSNTTVGSVFNMSSNTHTTISGCKFLYNIDDEFADTSTESKCTLCTYSGSSSTQCDITLTDNYIDYRFHKYANYYTVYVTESSGSTTIQNNTIHIEDAPTPIGTYITECVCKCSNENYIVRDNYVPPILRIKLSNEIVPMTTSDISTFEDYIAHINTINNIVNNSLQS